MKRAFSALIAGAGWACALGFSPALAQPADTAAMRARLAAIAQAYEPGFMGAVLVTRGDEVLLNRGYGKANLEWGLDNAPDVKFRIGSLTKQFTAALVLMLREDGKLDLASPLTRYLPDAPKAWAGITLAELLGQTSGIPDFTDDKRFGEWSMSPRTPADELAFFRDRPLEFTPGSRYEYSNSNYEVLGAIIEKVSGKSYADLLGERILKPLGLHETGVDGDELILARRAQGYKRGKAG
ncbi:MAG TPA: serine hydrolase domain-containing protein, partial [Caulobacteraceae bacterium]|nr:serine hydrolase domain-containing protein [Caulobacteraceae bacterium]